jgi:outer membrane protein, multidrug efflux system
MRNILPVTALSLAVLAGCTMAPTYKRPDAPVSPQWPAGAASPAMAGAKPVDEMGWSEFFKDARMRNVIGLALKNNRDMRVAALNVEKLRAQYRIQRADLLPSVKATGSGTRVRTPGELTSSGKPVTSSEYSAGVGVTSWELDLFGRVRSLKNEALETYLAGEQTRRSVQITLVAEVAEQYLTRLSLAEQLKLAQDTLDVVTKSRDLTRRMSEAGRSSQLDVQTAEAQVQTAIVNVAAYERQLAVADNALVLLVGQPLTADDLAGATQLENISFASDIAAGLTSDLLTRRPDILAAEHALKAANADIGAARAAFFPKITLTGSMGTESSELSGLFKSGSGAWSFTPSITVPIFAGGANKALLDVSKIEKMIEVANYEKAIQTGFKEVADTLASGMPLARELAADTALVAAQEKRYDLAQARFKTGFDSYLTVLSAQQDLYSAQQALINARLSLLSNRVTFYKVLGGGYLEASSM